VPGHGPCPRRPAGSRLSSAGGNAEPTNPVAEATVLLARLPPADHHGSGPECSSTTAPARRVGRALVGELHPRPRQPPERRAGRQHARPPPLARAGRPATTSSCSAASTPRFRQHGPLPDSVWIHVDIAAGNVARRSAAGGAGVRRAPFRASVRTPSGSTAPPSSATATATPRPARVDPRPATIDSQRAGQRRHVHLQRRPRPPW